MITVYRVLSDTELHEELDPGALRQIAGSPGEIYWVDVSRPTSSDLDRLAEQFGFHPVTLTTLAGSEQKARVHAYPGYYFLVAYTLEHEETSSRFRPVELDLYLGPNYVITVHDEPVSLVAEAKRSWRDTPTYCLGASELFYVIFDTLLDDYEAILQRAEHEYRELKRGVYEDCAAVPPGRFADLEERMFTLEEVMLPIRKDFAVLLREEQGLFAGSAQALGYFRELHSRAEGVLEELERSGSRIDTAFQGYAAVMSNTLAEQSNRMNASMSRLTVVMFSLGTAALLTSMFGMNFSFPLKDTAHGFWVALVLTGALTVVSLLYARERKWF